MQVKLTVFNSHRENSSVFTSAQLEKLQEPILKPVS